MRQQAQNRLKKNLAISACEENIFKIEDTEYTVLFLGEHFGNDRRFSKGRHSVEKGGCI